MPEVKKRLEGRAHPITIVANLRHVLYFSIVPVLRGFFFALQGGLGRWMRTAWVDISVVLLMFLFAVARWYVTRYRCTADSIQVNTGLFFRRRTAIDWRRVVTMSIVESFYLRPFRAVRFRADAMGGSFKDADIKLLLRPAEARRILQYSRGEVTEETNSRYIPRTKSIVALSLLTSNSFAGIVFMSTLISQAGKLLGDEFSQMLIGTVEELARMLAFGIPPAAAAIGYALLGGWFIGLTITFLRYKNFAVSRREDTLEIQGGLFTVRQYSIPRQEVNLIDVRQSVVTKLLRLYSLYISAVGYGKDKDDISCIIPTENSRDFHRNATMLFPAFRVAQPSVKPRLGGIMRFVGAPLAYIAGIAATMAWCVARFPNWREFVLFVGLMLLIPAVLFFTVRFMEFRTGGIGKEGNIYTICYSYGFSLHTVIIPAEKITQIELQKSFFQRFGPNCDLILSVKAERHSRHRSRSLQQDAVKDLFHLQ